MITPAERVVEAAREVLAAGGSPAEAEEPVPPGVPGLNVAAVPAELFPDRPGACFVVHAPSGRRMPATWPCATQAQAFVAAVRGMADWSRPHLVMPRAVGDAIVGHGGSFDSFGDPRLPVPAYVPTRGEVAELLAEALAVLDGNGWCRGDVFVFHDEDQEEAEGLDPSECRVCAQGAVNVAAEADPLPPVGGDRAILAEAAVTALEETLGVDDVSAWNDAPERTVAEVRDAFIRTIARYQTDGEG